MECGGEETLANSDSNSAPIFEKRILTETEQKDEINRNYLPNLSEYQQISYHTKKNEDYVLYPNVNYQDESKKSFYIFYNNNLSGLKNLYTKELKRLKNNYPFVLYHIMDFLDQLDLKLDADSYYNPFKLISKLISYNYQTEVDKARSIAKNLIKIKNIENSYKTDIKIKAFEIKVNDGKEGIFNELYFDEKYDYPAIEINFSILADKYKDSLSYIIELDKLLNYYLKELGENIVEENQKNKLCFILNRASFYLSNKEKLREDYKLNVLTKLDKLRRKINYLLLQNRFKFEENKRPFLNINIERSIILINSLKTTSIYIEKTELYKFIIELESALDRKANNLKDQKDFETMNLDEIGRIVQVRDRNITSNEKVKEEIANMIEELEEQKKKNEAEIESIAASIGMKLVGNTLQMISGIPPLNNIINEERREKTDDERKKEGMERINQLRADNEKIKKNITKNKNRLERVNVAQAYDIEFVNIFKLYKQLIRRNYDLRNNFSGVILSENREMAQINKDANKNKYEEQINLREYEIKEISKEVVFE